MFFVLCSSSQYGEHLQRFISKSFKRTRCMTDRHTDAHGKSNLSPNYMLKIVIMLMGVYKRYTSVDQVQTASSIFCSVLRVYINCWNEVQDRCCTRAFYGRTSQIYVKTAWSKLLTIFEKHTCSLSDPLLTFFKLFRYVDKHSHQGDVSFSLYIYVESIILRLNIPYICNVYIQRLKLRLVTIISNSWKVCNL